MSKFFNCCLKCQRTFTDENAYNAHVETHKGAPKKTVEKPGFTISQAAAEPVGMFSEEQIDAAKEAVKETNRMKKKLIQLGIEAQTMTPEQVRSRYEEEMAKIVNAKEL